MKIGMNKYIVVLVALIVTLWAGQASLRGHTLPDGSSCGGTHAPKTQNPELKEEHAGHDHGAATDDDHAGHAHAVGESCGASAAIKHAGHAHAAGESCGASAAIKHAGHAHGAATDDDHAGHDHGLKADVGLKPVAELYSMGCEHGINSVKCDDCRYEIGAVKITDMLAKMVKTDVLHKTKLKQAVNFRGELEYDNNLLRTVTSPVLGVVATMNVRVGDSVKAGQLLAVLESRELAGTALELQKLSSELGLAQKKYEREELLSSKKIGTAESLQNAKQAYDSLLLENKRLRGQLRIMGVSVGEIDKVENGQDSAAPFGRLSLTAPVNGRVTKVFTTIGGAIGEYQPVAEIADISKLRIKAFVGEKDIMSLLENAKTNNISGYLRVGAFKDIKFDVKFVGVDSEVSRGTRLLGVNLEVNNPDELLRPVMFAQGELFLGATEEYLLLPASAVFKDDSKNYVFVEHEDMFLMREVSVDYNYSEYALVKSGIKEGDKYVVEGSFLLQSDVFRGKMGAGCAH